MGRGRGGAGRTSRGRAGGATVGDTGLTAEQIAQNRRTANLFNFLQSLNFRDRQSVVSFRDESGRQTIDRNATAANLGRQSRRDMVSFGPNSVEFQRREASRQQTLDAIDKVLYG